MYKQLNNKIVVITGAASGIGFEIADKYLENGAKVVVLLDISEEHGNNALQMLSSKHGDERVDFYKCNVTTELEQVYKKIVDRYQYVDVLVNNAGVMKEDDVRKTIEINVIAVIEWTMKFWGLMRTDGTGKGGTILNLASIYGYKIDQYLPVYQASKHAVMAFTRSLGHSFAYEKSGVRVLALCPGFTKTGLGGDLNGMLWKDDFIIHMKKVIWQDPKAVADAAVTVFEIAESGTAWVIDGGLRVEQVPVQQ